MPFDAAERHPQVSPAELSRTRSLDLDGDGQIDLLTTADDFEEWTNLGGGSWAPVRRVPRTASFGDKLFPDVSFDDAAVFIADMNGDGRDEIVRVSARKIEYWARSDTGWVFKYTMRSAPRYADFDPARVLLADVSGNGAADLVYLTGNGVDLVLNVGGSRFAPPISLQFTDEGLSRGTPMPTSGAAALAVDLLGDGTRGLLWSFPRADTEANYFYLPLCTTGRPHLLTSFDNGVGGRVELAYSTSSVMAAEDEANGDAWTDEPPYPVVVVSELHEVDRVTDTRMVRRFRYRDGYYDRTDRSFRGFGGVEETVVGTATRRGGRVVHRFASGKPASPSAQDAAIARASAGAELSTAHYDLATGALLRRVDRQVETSLVRMFAAVGEEVTDPLRTVGGEYVAFTWERRRLESSYEGTASPRHTLTDQSRLVTVDGLEVFDLYGRLQAETRYGEVVRAGGATPVATFTVEAAAVPLKVADTDRQRRTAYTYAEDRGGHLVRYRSTEVTTAGASLDVVIGEVRRYFDGGADADDFLPAGRVSQGNVQREERLVYLATDLNAIVGAAAALVGDQRAPAWLNAGTTADGRAGWYAVERRRVFQRAGGRIAFGAVVREVDAAGNSVTRTFDDAVWFLRTERNALDQVTDHEAISYRAGSPRRTLLPNGSTTATGYDAFGRVNAVTTDAANSPLPQVATDRGEPARGPNSETVSRIIDHAETPLRHVVEVTYFDGWGRVVQVRRSAQSHAGDYVMIDRRYDAGGQDPSFESLPYFSAGSAFTPHGAQPGVTRYRDALSRVVRIVFVDGREARLDQAPWQIAVTDPEDADPMSPSAATPTVFGFDAARNVTEVTTTVRNADTGTAAAPSTTRYGYDAADRLVRIADAKGSVTELTVDARGDLMRVRHPDAGETVSLLDARHRPIYRRGPIDEWWFAYDELGRLTDEVPGSDPAQPAAVTRRYDGSGAATAVGRLTRAEVVADALVTDYRYDANGRVASVTRTIGGTTLASDDMSYDDLGEVSRHTFAGGAAVEWTRGVDGRIAGVGLRRPDGTLVSMVDGVSYHPSGRVAAADLSGTAVHYSAAFDAATYQLSSRAYLDAAGAPLYRLTNLAYDGVGNVRGYDEEAPPAGAVTWTLGYDSLYRLRTATARRGANLVADLQYWHDLATNVIRNDETVAGQTLDYDPARPDLVTGVSGGPAQYTYDGAGRLRTTPSISDVRWNGRNRVDRLTAAGAQLDLIHDHDRELLVVGDAYYFSPVHERHGGQDYYFALLDGSQAVAARDDGTCVVLARGMAGSVTRTLDQTGAAVPGSTEMYGPFGSAIESATAPWPRGFAGAVRAPNGLYLMGARPYLSGLGRFAAPDPVLVEPLPADLLFDPRRLSAYAYAMANPHTFVDPTGRLALIDDVIFYAVGYLTGLRHDPFLSGVVSNFVESWSVVLRSVFPFHSGTTPAQVAAWPIQATWGIAGLVAGSIAAYGAVELLGATTEMREHVQLITVPDANFGAFTLGNKVIGDATTLATSWQHEQGHYFQNLVLGPLYFPVIALPSIVHAGLHDIIHPGQSYEDFYTETWATAWGKIP